MRKLHWPQGFLKTKNPHTSHMQQHQQATNPSWHSAAWLLTAGTGSEILRQLVTIQLVGHKLVTIRLVRLSRKLVAIQLVGSSPPTSAVGLCCWHPALDQLCLPKQTLWFTNFTCVLSFQFCDPFPDCMGQWCYFSFFQSSPLARYAAMTAFLKGPSCPEVLIVRLTVWNVLQDYVSECPEENGFFADALQCDRYYECDEGVVGYI